MGNSVSMKEENFNFRWTLILKSRLILIGVVIEKDHRDSSREPSEGDFLITKDSKLAIKPPDFLRHLTMSDCKAFRIGH